MNTESFLFHNEDLPIEQQGFVRALNLSEHLSHGGTPEEIARLERDLAYFHTIERWVEDPKNYIDKGGAGRVYGFDKIGLCIKIMANRFNDPHRERFKLWNSALAEASIMSELDGFDVAGVRSPTPVQAVAGEHASAIIMERLNAVNVQHILNGTHQYPKSFDIQTFSDGVSDYLDALHGEKGIIHGDLYPRNVMVDLETGLPRVIDFGHAKLTGAMDPSEEHIIQVADWGRLEKTLDEVRRHHEMYRT